MTDNATTAPPVPRNIFYFEVLMYLSLAIDALSMPFREDAFSDLRDMSAETGKLITAAIILLFVYLVWLAAHRRKNWARMVLLASLVLSALSLVAAIAAKGVQLDILVDLLSAILTALGLYLSFTGDAAGWFARPRP